MPKLKNVLNWHWVAGLACYQKLPKIFFRSEPDLFLNT